jgi:hypothetical protein
MFGAGGKDKGMPTTGQAIQKLRETEEMLIKKQEFLEKKIDQELDIAKKNGTKNKRGLLLAKHFLLFLIKFVCVYSCYSGLEKEEEI